MNGGAELPQDLLDSVMQSITQSISQQQSIYLGDVISGGSIMELLQAAVRPTKRTDEREQLEEVYKSNPDFGRF